MLATLIWSAGGCARSATTPRPLRCETATQTAREARAQYRHERGGADDVVEFEVGPDRVTVIEAGTHTTYECTSRGLSLSATTTEGATWRFSPPLPVLPARNHRGELSGTAESDAGGRAEFVYTWDSAFSTAAGSVDLGEGRWRSVRSALIVWEGTARRTWSTETSWFESEERLVPVRRLQEVTDGSGSERTIDVLTSWSER
jgi:hypothetical protein